MTLILCVALFCVISQGCRVELSPGYSDILGFVEDGKIIADKPIVDGVIVTPEFVMKYRAMARELARLKQ